MLCLKWKDFAATLQSKETPGLDEGTYTKLQPGQRDLLVQESSIHRCDLKANDDHAIQQAATVSHSHQHE